MNRKSGYSLMELVVYFGIVSMLVIGGFATYRRFEERQRVVQAAEDLVTQLRIVQKRADVGELPAGCTDPLTGYTVSGTGSSLSINAECNGQVSAGTIPLTNGSQVTGSPSFTFNTLAGGSTASSLTIEVQSSGANWCVDITVSEGGSISTSDVAGC